VTLADDLRIVPRRELGRERWDALAEASDDAWLWHVDALADALATWEGATDHSFALVSPGGDPLAIVPLTSFAQARARGAVRFAQLLSLGGPAVDPSVDDRERRRVHGEAVDRALDVGRRLGAVRLDVSLAPLAPALRGDHSPRVNPLAELGLENTLTQTWIVDLRPGRDAVWRGLRSRARGEVRKAERSGVVVREAVREGDLDRYYALHVETYRRTGATPHPHAYFDRIWTDLVPAGRATVFFAELDGEVVAARSFATFKQAGLYWTGAASGRGLDVGAGALLQWHAMEWMLERGFEWSETGEAFPGTVDPKLRGLSLHKASFGGELYPLYRGRRTLRRRAYAVADALGRLRDALRP
jgi:hypothetical protein